MQDFSSILGHIPPGMFESEDEELFVSLLKIRKVKRRAFIEQPGLVSRYRTYVVTGALRAYFVTAGGQEHTISLAIDGGWIGDPGSFLLQEPATLYVEALEDCTLIQWSYESEQVMMQKIPRFAAIMIERSQQIAVAIQRRLISYLSLSAEERYEDFANSFPLLIRRIPLYVIASYLGMSREFLSKIRNHRTGTKQ